MMSKEDWKKVLDDVMAAVGAASSGGALHTAVAAHQGKPTNKKLSIALTCGQCASAMYFGISRIAANHWSKDSTPPAVSCPKDGCGHTGNHKYQGLARS